MRIVCGLAAVLLVACAAAGSYLLMRPTSASPARTDARPGPQADPQTVAPSATLTTADSAAGSPPATADAQGPASSSPARPQNARAADEPPPAAPRPASGTAADALGSTDANAGPAASVAAPSEADRNSASAQRPALVIQNPAPVPRPVEGPRPEDPRRAGELQQHHPPFRPEDGRRPPPPDGRRPLPPGGHPYPPPGRRPYP